MTILAKIVGVWFVAQSLATGILFAAWLAKAFAGLPRE